MTPEGEGRVATFFAGKWEVMPLRDGLTRKAGTRPAFLSTLRITGTCESSLPVPVGPVLPPIRDFKPLEALSKPEFVPGRRGAKFSISPVYR